MVLRYTENRYICHMGKTIAEIVSELIIEKEGVKGITQNGEFRGPDEKVYEYEMIWNGDLETGNWFVKYHQKKSQNNPALEPNTE